MIRTSCYVMMPLVCCLLPRMCLAQSGDPFLPGEYHVGHQVFEAVDAARNNRQVTTLVWYPADAGVIEGEPIRYSRPFGWMQQSPYIGGIMEAPVDDAGPFPLVVLSHGDGGVPQQFELLGEVLASHGYVVAAPQHSGNSNGTTNLPGMGSHRPADMSFIIDTMLNRNAAPGDLLSDAIHVDAIGVGGFSRGAATAAATVSGFRASRAGEFDTPPDPRVKALVLIDGTPETIDSLAPEFRETIALPTLSIGGAAGSFSANSNLLSFASPMYGADVIGVMHDDFTSGATCQFANGLLESNAPRNVLYFFGLQAQVECGPDLLPEGTAQEILARHTTVFLDSQLGNDLTNEDFLTPSRQNLAGNSVLRASVLGTGTSSQWADLILTDPLGRQVGVDPLTGEAFSDFTAREIRYLSGRSSRGFTVVADEALAGEYVLTAVGNASITEPRNLVVTLESMERRQHARVFERQLLLSAMVGAGMALEPLSFELVPIPELSADFNKDGQLTGDDINALASAVSAGSTDSLFDLSGDGQVSLADVDAWLTTKGTFNGDADLNGSIQFADFLILANSYGRPGSWTAGDFDASGQVQFPDFTILANNFGQSARGVTATVPEPTGALLLWMAVFGLGRNRSASRDTVSVRLGKLSLLLI